MRFITNNGKLCIEKSLALSHSNNVLIITKQKLDWFQKKLFLVLERFFFSFLLRCRSFRSYVHGVHSFYVCTCAMSCYCCFVVWLLSFFFSFSVDSTTTPHTSHHAYVFKYMCSKLYYKQTTAHRIQESTEKKKRETFTIFFPFTHKYTFACSFTLYNCRMFGKRQQNGIEWKRE